MNATESRRLHYFDMLKGIAIFMVVAGHVLTMCIRGIDRAVLFKFIGEMHMPLFFFISGWLTMKVLPDGSLKVPSFFRRARQLLLPMLVVSSIWICYFPHSGLESPLDSTWSGLWADVWKNGYWFTLVLFEIILIYGCMCPLMKVCRTSVAGLGAIMAVWALLGAIDSYVLPSDVSAMLSFELVVRFAPVFLFGALAARHRGGFDRAVSSSWTVTVAVAVGGALLYYVCWPWEFPSVPAICHDIARTLLHVAVAIVAISVVRPWSSEAYSSEAVTPHRWARMWSFVGSNSLAIYLLHYFFLFPMGLVRPVVEQMNLGFVPLLVFCSFWAAAIIAVTLGVNCVIKRSRWLSMLLTGA